MYRDSFLTAEDREALSSPETMSYGHHGKPWRDRVIELDALPLAMLAEQAARGYRVYEFMTLARPGDMLRYLRVKMVDVSEREVRQVQGRLRSGYKSDEVQMGSYVTFDDFERSHWVPERPYCDDDGLDGSSDWHWFRQGPAWAERLTRLLSRVRLLQHRLRDKRNDFLLQHELGLIEATAHRRDYWAKNERIGDVHDLGPVLNTTVPDSLAEFLATLARHPGIKSISAPFEDYWFWRTLVTEQVKRSLQDRVAPEQALLLSGPDGGLRKVRAADWGGAIHIPYEGARDADVFVLPDWHAWDAGRAAEGASARAGSSVYGPPKAGKVLIAKRDLGEFADDDRIVCDGWFIYRTKDFR